MISKEQIEQIVSKTLAQMKDSQCQCGSSDNGWMFDDAAACVEAASAAQAKLVALTMEHRGKIIDAMRCAARKNAVEFFLGQRFFKKGKVFRERLPFDSFHPPLGRNDGNMLIFA